LFFLCRSSEKYFPLDPTFCHRHAQRSYSTSTKLELQTYGRNLRRKLQKGTFVMAEKLPAPHKSTQKSLKSAMAEVQSATNTDK
jgi:hypothetical protein